MLGMYRLFGENPIPFHLLSLFIHFVNSLLVALVIRRVTKNGRIACFSAILYSASLAVDLDSQLWMVGIYDLLCVLFFLLSLLFFLHRKLALSVIAFVLSLLSKESSFMLPAILLSYHILYERTHLDSMKVVTRKRILPAMVATSSFVIIMFLSLLPKILGHVLYVDFPATHPYVIKLFGTHVVVNLVAYPAWMIQTFLPFMRTRDPIFVAFVVIFGVFTLWAVKHLFSQRREATVMANVFFFFIWIVLALGPAMFLANHRYGYYAVYALPAFLAFVLVLFDNAIRIKIPGQFSRIMIIVVATVVCSSMYQSHVLFKYRLHDGISRAAIASDIRSGLMRYLPNPPNGAILVFDGLDTEFFAKENGPRFWYKNGSIDVYTLEQINFDEKGAFVLDVTSESQKTTLLGRDSRKRYIDLRKTFFLRYADGRLVRDERGGTRLYPLSDS